MTLKLERLEGMFCAPVFFEMPEQFVVGTADEVKVNLKFPSGLKPVRLHRLKDFEEFKIMPFRNKEEAEAMRMISDSIEEFTLSEELIALSRDSVRQQKKLDAHKEWLRTSQNAVKVLTQANFESADRIYKLEKLLKENGIEVPK